jgi:protein TonB
MSRKLHFRRILPGLIGVVLVAAVGVGAALLIGSFMGSEPPKVKKVVQNITLIKPPPPPPKIEEQPPEPEIEEEKVELEEPETLEEIPEMPGDDAPPGDTLGLDADGSGTSDGFGLIGRKGGRSLLASGMFGGYATVLRKSVEQALHRDDRIRSRRYSVVLRMWVDSGGQIERVTLRDTTGEPAVDDAIVDSLTGLALGESPPLEMPMPVKMRITARL